MTAPKRPPHNPKGFSEEQKQELALIIASSLKTELSAAIRAELKDAGLRLDGDANQSAASADFQFVRRVRIMFESASSKIGGAIILALVMGLTSIFVYGAKAFLGK
jgi:hypothetical protein